MASRKEEKDRRREARLEAEQRAQSEQRRKKLLAGTGAAALAAMVVIVALVVVSQSGDDGGEVSATANAPTELDSLPQDGRVLGDSEAEVTVVEFGDLQCPVCAEFSRSVVPELISEIVEPGEASLEYRNFVIIGPDSEVAAKAALAAAEQDRYWQFIDVFYESQGPENSGYVTDGFLRDVADRAGVPDLEQWEADRDDPSWDEEIAQTATDAQKLGFSGTPSILVEGPNGTIPLGSVGAIEDIEKAIDDVR